MQLPDAVLELAAAALGGLAVGVEREWSARNRGRRHDFAGVRTFLLLGLVGGLGAELVRLELPFAGGVLLASGALLTLLAYGFAARAGDLEATTEVAGLVVLAAGALAGSGRIGLASGIAVVTALLLMEKTRIHAAVYQLKNEEISAGLRFAVLAVVVLPLLPEGPFGPEPGLRPRQLWLLVLIFSGLSFAGYVGLRAAGPRRGYALAGLLGGLVSSTATTLGFARESRGHQDDAAGLALGIVVACTVVYLRVAVVAAALRPELGLRSLLYVVPPFAVGVLACLVQWRHSGDTTADGQEMRNPLALGASLRMALLFQVVLYAVAWSRSRFGAAGVLGSAALLGLTDMDALTLSMARQTEVEIAAKALGIGLLANNALKTAIAGGLGRDAVRTRAVPALLALAAAGGVAILVF